MQAMKKAARKIFTMQNGMREFHLLSMFREWLWNLSFPLSLFLS